MRNKLWVFGGGTLVGVVAIVAVLSLKSDNGLSPKPSVGDGGSATLRTLPAEVRTVLRVDSAGALLLSVVDAKRCSSPAVAAQTSTGAERGKVPAWSPDSCPPTDGAVRFVALRGDIDRARIELPEQAVITGLQGPRNGVYWWTGDGVQVTPSAREVERIAPLEPIEAMTRDGLSTGWIEGTDARAFLECAAGVDVKCDRGDYSASEDL